MGSYWGAEPLRDDACGGRVRAVPGDRARPLLQLGDGGEPARALAVEGGHRAIERAGVCRRLPRRHPPLRPRRVAVNPPFEWVVGEYNDAAGAARLVEEHARDLAAVIVEPLQGAAGVIRGDPAFLRALREATAAHDVLLVFDEVMTARLAHGGMQELVGIDADLTTLAKFVGGGLSFGAFGGRADLMSRFDPSRTDALQHGGTFNNDVLTMAAGSAGLTRVLTEAEIARLNALGDRLRDRLNAFAAERELEFCATGYGSLVGLHFARGPVRSERDVPVSAELRGLLHLHMLEQGFSYGRRGFIALSLPLGEAEIDGFSAAVEEFLATV